MKTVAGAVGGGLSTISKVAQVAGKSVLSVGNAASWVVAPVERLGILGVTSFVNITKSVVTAGLQMAKFAAATAAIAFPAIAIKQFADVERIALSSSAAMAKSTKDIRENGRAMAVDLRRLFVELSENNPLGASEIGDVGLTFARAGMGQFLTKEAMQPILDGIIATGADSKMWADLLVGVTSQFKFGPEKMGDVNNALVSAANISKINPEDFQPALQYAGPAAAATGLPFEDLLAMIGVGKQKGLDASIIGTSLRGLAVELIAPTDKAKATMQQFGIQVQKVDAAAMSEAKAFRAATSALDENEQRTEDLKVALVEQNRELHESTKHLKDQQRAYERTGDKIKDSKEELDGYKKTLEAISRVKLPGMEAADDGIFAMEQQLKALQLQRSQMSPFDIFGQNAADNQIAALEKRIAEAELQRDITFNPQTRGIEKASEAAEEAMRIANGGNNLAGSTYEQLVLLIGQTAAQYVEEADRLQVLEERHESQAKAIEKEQKHIQKLTDAMADARDEMQELANVHDELAEQVEVTGAAFERAFFGKLDWTKFFDDVGHAIKNLGMNYGDLEKITGKRPLSFTYLLASDMDMFRDFGAKIRQHVQEGISSATADLQRSGVGAQAEMVKNRALSLGNDLVELFEPQIRGAMDRVKNFIDQHGNDIVGKFKWVKDKFTEWKNDYLSSNEGIWPHLRTLVGNGFENLSLGWSAGHKLLTGDVEGFKSDVSKIWVNLGENTRASVSIITDLIGKMIPPQWQSQWLVFRSVVTSMFRGERSIVETVKLGVQGVVGAIGDLWKFAEPYVDRFVFHLRFKLQKEWQMLQPMMYDALNALLKYFEGKWSELSPKFVEIGTKIGRAIASGMASAMNPANHDFFNPTPGDDAIGVAAFRQLTPQLQEQLKKSGRAMPRETWLQLGDKAKEAYFQKWKTTTPLLYANGGIVPGRGTSDTVPALLTPGERVLTKNQNAAYERGGVTINFNGPVNASSDADLKRLTRKISEELYKEHRRVAAGMPA